MTEGSKWCVELKGLIAAKYQIDISFRSKSEFDEANVGEEDATEDAVVKRRPNAIVEFAKRVIMGAGMYSNVYKCIRMLIIMAVYAILASAIDI